jgi:hypothetical protein
MSSPADPQDLFVFLQHQGAADTTLGALLRSRFAPGEIADIPGASLDADSVAALVGRSTRLLLAECPVGVHRHLRARVRYVTMLREPAARVLALYHDRRATRGDGLTAPGDVVGWIESERPIAADNAQTRALSASQPPFGAVTREMLDAAKACLRERLEVVALADRFDESCVLLQRRFDWPPPLYAWNSLSPDPSERLACPADVRDALLRHNPFDLELFEYATALFDARVADEGESFARDLARFRRLNARLADRVRFMGNGHDLDAVDAALIDDAARVWGREEERLALNRRVSALLTRVRQPPSAAVAAAPLRELRAELRAARRARDVGAERLDKERAQMRALKTALRDRETRIAAVEARNRRVEEQLAQQARRAQELEARAQLAEQRLADAVPRALDLEREIAALVTHAEQQAAASAARVAALEQDVAALTARHLDSERQAADYQRRGAEYEARSADYERRCADHERRLAEYDAQRAEYAAQLSDAEHAMRELDEQHRRQAAQIEERLIAIRQKQRVTRERVQRLRTANEALRGEIDLARQRKAALDASGATAVVRFLQRSLVGRAMLKAVRAWRTR